MMIMYCELERLVEKAIVVYLKAISGHFVEALTKIYANSKPG